MTVTDAIGRLGGSRSLVSILSAILRNRTYSREIYLYQTIVPIFFLIKIILLIAARVAYKACHC